MSLCVCENVLLLLKRATTVVLIFYYIVLYRVYVMCILYAFSIATHIKRLLFSHLHILFSFIFLSFSLSLSIYVCFVFVRCPFFPNIEVDHTIILYLVDPNGEFIDYYGLGKAADEIVLSVKRNMDKWEKLHANTNWFKRLFS